MLTLQIFRFFSSYLRCSVSVSTSSSSSSTFAWHFRAQVWFEESFGWNLMREHRHGEIEERRMQSDTLACHMIDHSS